MRQMKSDSSMSFNVSRLHKGVQDLIRKRPGVINTRVGYTGGDVPNATYRNHGSHAEAIEIEFDPTRISYRDLLEFFFQIVRGTMLARRIGRRFSMSPKRSVTRRLGQSTMSTRPTCGRAGW
jgi:Peptide methionine sulfoxide reductase